MATASRLLNLPVEARYCIYQFLFANSVVRIHLPTERLRKTLSPEEYHRRAVTTIDNPNPTVLLVCRQLNAEATDALYSISTLRICSMSSIKIDIAKVSVPTRIRALCKTIAIDYELATDVPGYRKLFPHLKTVVLERCATIQSYYEDLDDMSDEEWVIQVTRHRAVAAAKDFTTGIDMGCAFVFLAEDGSRVWEPPHVVRLCASLTVIQRATYYVKDEHLSKEPIREGRIFLTEDCPSCIADFPNNNTFL